MPIKSSLRRETVTTFGLFTLLVSLAFAGLCVMVAYVIEDQVIDNLLKDEVQHLQGQHDQGHPLTPRLPFVSVFTSKSDAPDRFQQAIAGRAIASELFTDDGSHYHLRKLSPGTGDGPLIVAEVSRLLTVSGQSGNLLTLIFTVLVIAIALALYLATRIAAKTTKPIISLAQEVQQQLFQASPVGLTETCRSDEIGYLARALQDTINQLKMALERESAFTHDVGHELRTSLTILQNDLMLMENSQFDAGARTQLQQRVSGMSETVEILLALARAESTQKESFDLRALIEEALLERRHQFEAIDLTVDLPRRLPVSGNRNLASLLCSNLLDNAIQHASTPTLRISETDSHTVVFANPANEPDALSSWQERGIKGAHSDGIGHGLYLCRRLLSALGWESELRWLNGEYQFALRPASAV